MVAPIRYLSRRIQEQKIGILQNTEEEKVLEVIGRVGIGTTIFDAEYNLDVRGTANVSGILSVGQIISGAGNTFSDLTVTGDTDLQSDVIIGGGLTVTGVSTFQSAALFADGTEAEPSISFINDTDLGLYRPADNEIAFTNGGSESVRITSDGKVGIGTTQPSSKLSVFSSDVTTETRIESTDSAGYASIFLKSDDIEGAFYASSAEGVIVLRNNSNTTGTALGLAGTRSSGSDIKIFRETRNVVIGNNSSVSSQTGTANQKLQVQSGAYISGSVGIGTTLPSQKLDVNGNVNIRGELHGPEIFIIDPAAVGDNTGAVRIKGDLYVDGTEFIVDSENILLADYRVGIATTVATNLLLDGAGISIGATNIEKTFTYNNTANTLESSIGLGVTEGGEFKTGTDSVLNRTTLGPTVVNSSLTNLGTLTELNVSGVSTFNDLLDINGNINIDGSQITYTSSSNELKFADDAQLRFGGGNDLRIYHGSGASFIQDAGSGSLFVETDGGGIRLRKISGSENLANFYVDGAVELYYDNSKKFETTGAGVTVFGTTESQQLVVSGISTFSGDISIADKITHIGDTDTAIRFPAADTFTVETAGVERVRVNSAGNVGIGTDNIVDQLTLGSSTNQLLGFETDNEPTIQSYNANLHINTAGNDVVFDGNGSVGIGTDNPSQLLDVNGDVRFRDKIFDSTGDSGVANYVLASGGPGAPWSWKLLTDVGAGTLDAIFVRQDGSDVGAAGTNTTLDFYENFSLTQPVAGIASIRLADTINIDAININETTLVGSATSSLTTVASTPIYTGLSTTIYRSVEYTIQATEGNNFQSTKILALHDGTTAYHSEYGTIFNNSSVATFDVDVSGGNIRLVAVGATSDQTDYVINFTATKL